MCLGAPWVEFSPAHSGYPYCVVLPSPDLCLGLWRCQDGTLVLALCAAKAI